MIWLQVANFLKSILGNLDNFCLRRGAKVVLGNIHMNLKKVVMYGMLNEICLLLWYMKYKLSLIVFLLCSSLWASFYIEDHVRQILYYIYFPIFIGFILRDFYLKIKLDFILNKLLVLLGVVFIYAFSALLFFETDTERFYSISFLLFCIWPWLSHYVGDKEKYIGWFDISFYIPQTLLFSYGLSIFIIYQILPFLQEKIDTERWVFFWIYFWIIIIFSLFTAFFSYLLYQHYKNYSSWLKVYFNITGTIMSFILGIYYIFAPFFGVIDYRFNTFKGNYEIFFDFLILWFILWFFMQYIVMLWWYIPWKHQRDNNWGIKYANKKLLMRVPQEKPLFLSLIFTLGIGFVGILFLHTYILYSIDQYDALPKNPGSELLIAILFMVCSVTYFLSQKYPKA